MRRPAPPSDGRDNYWDFGRSSKREDYIWEKVQKLPLEEENRFHDILQKDYNKTLQTSCSTKWSQSGTI